MSTDNEPTIGTIEWNGKTYEIDWPFDLDDPKRRDDITGAIYLNGRQVGECCPTLGAHFTTKQDVLDAAFDVIVDGDTDDQDGGAA